MHASTIATSPDTTSRMFEHTNNTQSAVGKVGWARRVIGGGGSRGNSNLYYICRRIMIKYSGKVHLVLPTNKDSSPYSATRENVPTSKPVSFTCNVLGLSRLSHNENQAETTLTPRAKAFMERRQQQDIFSKSITTTPTKQRVRKEHSFILPPSTPKEESKQLSPTPTSSIRQTWTDRSQRILKTRAINNDASMRRMDQMAKLRQTVSNATSWQYRDLAPSNTATALRLPADERKKELDYQQVKKEFKSKFASKQHSRNNSKTEDLFNTQPPQFETIPKTPTKTTPRVSQDKLTVSTVSKDRSTSKIELLGNLSPLSMIKKSTSCRPADLRIQDFALGACKGQGRFGKVFPAIHKRTGFVMAIKQVAKESVRIMVEQFAQEIKISLFLNHPNVVKVYGCFCDKESVYIMMEYMEEGSLYRLVKLAKRFSQEQAGTKLTEVCEAVRYLHSQDILHRDIKPQNIVLSNGVCKLCDFGWATYSKQRRTTYCGTLDYVCPEILQGQSYDNFVDIWAIGVLAYEMLVGKAPFYHISRKQTMKSILNCQFTFPGDISVAAKLFIKKALQKKPDLRFTVDSLLKDRFLLQLTTN